MTGHEVSMVGIRQKTVNMIVPKDRLHHTTVQPE